MKRRFGQALLLGGALLLNVQPTLRADEPPSRSAAEFTQQLGATLPLEVALTDASGQRHRLGDYFHGRPVVLYFGYARCPQLCSVVADGTVAVLRQLRAEVGTDLEVVSLSIDPDESTAENARRKSDAVHRYGRPGDRDRGWHFLTGREPAIRTVTAAAGFRYTFDARSRQYAHPSGFLIATPDGRISAYFLGLDFPGSDVASALARAQAGRVGQPVFQLLLLCFRGDGVTGRYGPLIWRTLTILVLLTVLAVSGGIGWMLREERRRAREGAR
jgi:protein SCO1/2